MYEIFTANSKTEKILHEHISMRKDIIRKLDLLKIDPKKFNGAHPLHGRLKGKWACWLGSNIRIIYSINDVDKIIIIEAVGTHKIY
ncbi:MAG TPA: type II toxin-antitoxin system mRNA interferase toxin, RelE/StbE family [Candidatus Nanoarchaeia archaeon]|nr:type II toxin-antitoxin system mRNA interferase toxin, RelE/StbE family [Candidatus Nanoarchaeia archaeon]